MTCDSNSDADGGLLDLEVSGRRDHKVPEGTRLRRGRDVNPTVLGADCVRRPTEAVDLVVNASSSIHYRRLLPVSLSVEWSRAVEDHMATLIQWVRSHHTSVYWACCVLYLLAAVLIVVAWDALFAIGTFGLAVAMAISALTQKNGAQPAKAWQFIAMLASAIGLLVLPLAKLVL